MNTMQQRLLPSLLHKQAVSRCLIHLLLVGLVAAPGPSGEITLATCQASAVHLMKVSQAVQAWLRRGGLLLCFLQQLQGDRGSWPTAPDGEATNRPWRCHLLRGSGSQSMYCLWRLSGSGAPTPSVTVPSLPPGDAAWHSHTCTSPSNVTGVWPEARLHIVCKYQASQAHRRCRQFVSSCSHLPLLCTLRAHWVHCCSVIQYAHLNQANGFTMAHATHV